MPYFGLLLFYDRVIALHDSKINVFQCPTTGFLPFYRTVLRVLATWDNCFNALFRAFFFSTRREMEDHMISVSLFQCPISGFLLFYQLEAMSGIKQPVSFNALPRAFFFSTLWNDVVQFINSDCFNALPRAFFFSTFLKPFQSYQFQRFQCPTSGFLLFYTFPKYAN